MNLNSEKVLSAIEATARRNEALVDSRNRDLHGAQRPDLSEARRQRTASRDAMAEHEVQQVQQAVETVLKQTQLAITSLLIAHFEAHPDDVAPLAVKCDQPTSTAGTQEIHLALATFLAPVLQRAVARAGNDREPPACTEQKAGAQATTPQRGADGTDPQQRKGDSVATEPPQAPPCDTTSLGSEDPKVRASSEEGSPPEAACKPSRSPETQADGVTEGYTVVSRKRPQRRAAHNPPPSRKWGTTGQITCQRRGVFAINSTTTERCLFETTVENGRVKGFTLTPARQEVTIFARGRGHDQNGDIFVYDITVGHDRFIDVEARFPLIPAARHLWPPARTLKRREAQQQPDAQIKQQPTLSHSPTPTNNPWSRPHPTTVHNAKPRGGMSLENMQEAIQSLQASVDDLKTLISGQKVPDPSPAPSNE